jgi:uncharacterized protein YydD (DUF2326 family)
MFLKYLKILNGNSVINEILFHKGINLIVDETQSDSSKKTTGNNVGKTTVLRLVDYCFGGDGKNIYKDTEFKNQPNSKIEKFLKENNIEIEIKLVVDLENPNSECIVIKRNFLQRNNKVQSINGVNFINNNEFDKKLKELIFKTSVDKPTFRQIISKNIRDEKSKMTNIVKVLNLFVTSEIYEALYLFWLGIETDQHEQKQKLSEIKKREENFQKRLKKEGELSLVLQQLSFINSKLEECREKKKLFIINDKYEKDIEDLNSVKQKLNSASTLISKLLMRRNLIQESKIDLEKEHSKIDSTQIKLLYEKANMLIPSLQVSFEETIKFHNELITEKLKYITRELPALESSINTCYSEIAKLQDEERILTASLRKTGFTENLENLILETNKLSEKKGNLEEQKRVWESSLEKLKNIDNELLAINSGIISQDDLIQSRIEHFNTFFSNISNDLYSEYYLLSSQKTDKGYDLVITNIEGNPSAGKKKGQIAAFDFAYIKFADSLDINCLHFIMHDQLENIHDNQLNIIIEVANDLNGQYIVPILRDKVPSNIDIEKLKVISLSQNNKLFKV